VNAGAGVIVVGTLVAGGWLWWHRDAPKTCTGLFLVAGLVIGGVLGDLLGGLFTHHGPPTTSTSPAPASSAVGVWVSVILAGVGIAATAELVVKGMWPRRAKPRRWHPWLALALPTLVIAAGVPMVGPLMTGLAGGVSNVGAAMVATTHTAQTTQTGRR
jgi:membrane protease YdiL (CAAX protease family)